ncbi:hypothetical protein [Aeromonas veronii]|uniref:hypothetical protein n=1 Tax=Aeromonas veronii TaxID=654 RepID=UPI000A9D323E|nr:hypothetical protein [Aeromonas veronii]
MTNHDYYVLETIQCSGKTNFTAEDFSEVNPEVLHSVMLSLKARGLLNFVNASADTTYGYLNVSLTTDGLQLLKELESEGVSRNK